MNSHFYKHVVSHQNKTLNSLKERFGIEITGAEKLNLILKLAVIPSADLLQEKIDVHLGALVDGLDAETTEIVVAENQAGYVDHGEYGYSFRSTNGFSLHTSVKEDGTKHCSLVNSHGAVLMNLDDDLESPSSKKMGEILRAMQLDALSASYNATLGSDPRKSSVISLQAVEMKRFLEYKEVELDSRGMAEILAMMNGAPDLDSFTRSSGINLIAAFDDIREGIVEGRQQEESKSKYFFIQANALVPSVAVAHFDEQGDVSKLQIRTLDGVDESVVESAQFPTLFAFISKMANDMRGLEFDNPAVISEFYASLEEDYDDFEDDDENEEDFDDGANERLTIANDTTSERAVSQEILQQDVQPGLVNEPAAHGIQTATEQTLEGGKEPDSAPLDQSTELKKNLFKPAGRFGF
ncbi:hypothetical protein CL689_06070 [Candidatus Saccharibacteria bacterium]|nr:hypothetical protein [Candidatus Saccharibacteria bacterium]|tara:strand:+ start:1923 stop:3152 length:1230 start_codon:yes stop_codon:yes gene_type:complete